MKFLHLTFHFEYMEMIETILEREEVRNFVRYPLMQGRDRDGKHYGSQVFPGNVTVIQAQVAEEKVESLLAALRAFREEREAHQHVEALILGIEEKM